MTQQDTLLTGSQEQEGRRCELLLLYDKEDMRLAETLILRLKILARQEQCQLVIRRNDDTLAGQRIDATWRKRIEEATLIVALVSPSLHANVTLRTWLETARASRPGTPFVSIWLRPLTSFAFSAPGMLFGARAVPADKPVTQYRSRDAAWDPVIEELRPFLSGDPTRPDHNQKEKR